ncbi:MAG TPA: TRAP transporter large permease [Oligella sp.]|nr:TRAP transporter large permease [Oligella sp.]
MDWITTISLMFGGVIFFLLLGVPIAFSFLTVNLIGGFLILGGELGLLQTIRNMQTAVAQYSLAPIVLFVFMGEVMLYTGIAARAINAIDQMFTKVPGRLSMIAIVGGAVFSSLSGSTIANTAVLGKTLLPQMKERGYSPSISMGPIMAIGGIAMLIPPSGLAVLLASLAQVSINHVLIAGIIPATLMVILFFAYIIIRCLINPSLAPSYEVEQQPLQERIKPFLIYVAPLILIFIAVVGSMIMGIATPTESAALGSIASLTIAAVYRALTIHNIVESIKGTLKFSAMILFVICTAATFSQILAFSGATATISQLVTSMEIAPFLILLAMLLLLLILGCFMDQISMMMLTLPVFMPIIRAAGFDDVWFIVLMLVVLEISLTTPPLGLLIFVMQSVAPKSITLRQIYASVTPFIIMELVVLGLMVIFPLIALWLPQVLLN